MSSPPPSLSAFTLKLATARKPRPKDSELVFGRSFTDHMAIVDWEAERGWFDPRVVPYGPLVLDPAAAVLHYGQEMFDGLKAFRGVDGVSAASAWTGIAAACTAAASGCVSRRSTSS